MKVLSNPAALGAGSTPVEPVPGTVGYIKRVVFIASALASAVSGFGQGQVADLYLGEMPPDENRKLFLSGIANRIAITRDGHEIYFGDWNGIQCIKYNGSQWIGPLDITPGVSNPALSGDDQTLYVQDAAFKILEIKRSGQTWSAPSLLIQDPVGLNYFQAVNSGNAYATRIGSASIQGQISLLKKTGVSYSVESLGPPINSADNGVDFYVARDESYIIFVVHPGGTNGDLYISFRKRDGSWTNPKNMGPKVNSPSSWEWGPYVTFDNKYLFYTSASNQFNVGVYWLRVDRLIECLKHSNFAPYVRLPVGPQQAVVGRPFRYRIPAETFVDDDGENTLSFSASLSGGRPLPNWIRFSPRTLTFSGTAPEAGEMTVRITATDNAQASVSTEFILSVATAPAGR